VFTLFQVGIVPSPGIILPEIKIAKQTLSDEKKPLVDSGEQTSLDRFLCIVVQAGLSRRKWHDRANSDPGDQPSHEEAWDAVVQAQ
jgi:hypothetical protein